MLDSYHRLLKYWIIRFHSNRRRFCLSAALILITPAYEYSRKAPIKELVTDFPHVFMLLLFWSHFSDLLILIYLIYLSSLLLYKFHC